MTIVHEEKHNLCLPKPNSSHCTIIVTPSWAAEPKIKAILCTSFNSTKVSNAYHSKKKIKLYTKTSTIDAYLNIPMIPYWAIGPKFMTVKSHYNVQHKWCKSNLRNNEVNLPPVLKSYMVSIRQEALTGINKFPTIWYHTSSTTFLSMIPRQKVKCPRQWRDSILCSLQNPEHYSSVTITVTFCEQKQSKDIYIYIYIYISLKRKQNRRILPFYISHDVQVTKMNILVWHFSMSATLHQTLRFWPGFTNHHMSTSHCPSQNVIQ